jgi:hypothetical protein
MDLFGTPGRAGTGIEAGRVVLVLVLVNGPDTDVVTTAVLEILEGLVSSSILPGASSEGMR